MTKTVCDICGREMPTTKHVDKIENLNFCISSHGKIWDICVKCREDLNRWMTIRKQEQGNKNIVEGVTCKDCKYYRGNEDGTGYCTIHTRKKMYFYCNDDFYCADGERRE